MYCIRTTLSGRKMMRLMRSKISNATLKAFSTALDKCTYSEANTSSLYFDPSQSIRECEKVSNYDVDKGKEFIDGIEAEQLLVITGSGISTDSGYMDMNKLEEKGYKPMQFKDEKDWQRFWAQYYAIWPEICKVKPNRAHCKIHLLEKQNKLQWIFTKNVDNLHSLAGSKKVTELYGSILEVLCQTDNCDHKVLRKNFQEEMHKKNASIQHILSCIISDSRFKGFPPNAIMKFNEKIEDAIEKFKVPLYAHCNGNPKHNFRYLEAQPCAKRIMKDKLSKSDKILVLGTSLSEGSYIQDILIDAYRNGKQILVVNIDEGPFLELQKKSKDLDRKSESRNGREMRFIKANCGEFLQHVVTNKV